MSDPTPTSPAPLLSRDGAKLFSLGFLTLFLELALIRYLAGTIWNLGYFPNLVLISVFIGMGLGFMLHHRAGPRLSATLFHLSAFILLGLIAYAALEHPTVPGFTTWRGDLGGDLYFTATPKRAAQASPAPFVACLLGITVVCAFLSQRTAKLFARFRPLTAYTLDISGSSAGIVAFLVISWLGIPAWVWFIAFSVVLVVPAPGRLPLRLLPLVPGALVVLLVHRGDARLTAIPDFPGASETAWSPYQKVEYANSPPRLLHRIWVNGVSHQNMEELPQIRRMFYQTIHDVRRRRVCAAVPACAAATPQTLAQCFAACPDGPAKSVLVLGAGSGNDVAAALANGAEHVDAVEIDPVIADLGRRHHPARPYDDPRVSLIIDDGRAFMTRTSRRYDLVVFALTDSVVKVSSMSQLRLENYLFTLESVARARALLRAGGEVVFYNYYRQPWLRLKIEEMIRRAGGVEPEVLWTQDDFAVLALRDGGRPAAAPDATVDVPTDNWPFLYLVRRGIPEIYGKAMIGMCLFVTALITALHLLTRKREEYGGRGVLSTKLAFVFMGVAFMLLETKSVIQFSLLFGTTWLNSSLVFLGVLVLVLVANWTALLIKTRRFLPLIYALLILSALSSFVFPLGGLLRVESGTARFFLASLLTFSPIFFANLVFSIAFRDQPVAEHVFGWNLIGSTIGGIAEYASMYLGYASLAVVVAVCYALVVVLLTVGRRRALAKA